MSPLAKPPSQASSAPDLEHNVAQKSSIDKLPAEVLDVLQSYLRGNKITQQEATQRVNVLLQQFPEVEPISKSAVNRYSMRMDQVGAKIRESREVAKMWAEKFGETSQGEIGNLVNESLRNIAFDMTLLIQDADLTDPKQVPGILSSIKALSLTMQRLEKAANLNREREKEIRKDAIAEGVATATDSARERGVPEEEIDFWVNDFLKAG